MEEIWKDIKNYEGIYQVSNLGRVKSLERWIKRKDGYKNHIKESIRKNKIINSGYLVVGLHKNGVNTNLFLHRLVAEAFIDNPNNYPQVNHIDENKTNNCVNNLEWCDAKYNNNYGEHKNNLRNSLTNRKDQSKPVLQFDLNGNFIKEWESTMEIQRQTGMKCQFIGQVCLGKKNVKTAYGYIWKYKKAV